MYAVALREIIESNNADLLHLDEVAEDLEYLHSIAVYEKKVDQQTMMGEIGIKPSRVGFRFY